MNKSLFLAPLFMAAFASCSNEDVAMESNGNEQTSGVSYLSVNIMNTTSGGGAGAKGIAKANGDYEFGLDSENAVKKVRFYFFNEDGTAAKVKGLKDTYLDYTPGTTTPGAAGQDNIEKNINATLVIESSKNDGLPASLIAVVNPTNDLGEVASIDDLNSKVSGTFMSGDNFVMSNSVYTLNSKKMEAVSVRGKLFETEDKALGDPVTIYVERQAAKVRVQNMLTATDTEGVYSLGNGFNVDNEDTEIFVKFLGWNTTATADKSYLMKSIDEKWENIFVGMDWNASYLHRSFWAINPKDVEYNYFSFDSDKTTDARAKTFFSTADDADNTKAFSYVHENAENAKEYTKVIVAAQLCDKDGHPLNLVEWRGLKFTSNNMKIAMVEAGDVNLWKKETLEGGSVKYTRLTPEDVTFKSVTEVNGTAPDQERYWSYLQLADGDWDNLVDGNTDNAKTVSKVDANKILAALGHVKAWNNGYTYYYFDLKHLGSKVGVVRNHIYNANIKKVQGLGTPVYNPGEVIIPESPKTEETYIAAEINILSWRVVDQDVNLGE